MYQVKRPSKLFTEQIITIAYFILVQLLAIDIKWWYFKLGDVILQWCSVQRSD